MDALDNVATIFENAANILRVDCASKVREAVFLEFVIRLAGGDSL